MTDSIINPEEILAQFVGDYEVAREVIQVFLEDSPNAMVRLREAVRGKDPEEIRKSAHALKGAASNFSARVADRGNVLEQMGASGNLQGAEEGLARLEEEIMELESALTGLMADESFAGA